MRSIRAANQAAMCGKGPGMTPRTTLLTLLTILSVLYLGGCGTSIDGPSTAGEWLMGPVERNWGCDIETASVRLLRAMQDRRNAQRVGRATRTARKWLNHANTEVTETVLDAIAGPPPTYNNLELTDDELKDYFREYEPPERK